MDTVVFVLCLNHAAITKRCIESLLATVDLSCTEIVVFDNGSTDNTPRMLKTFGDKITRMKSPTNIGAPRAVNKGHLYAKDKLFVKMANDHIMTPGWLEKIWVQQAKRPGIYSPITIDTPAVPSLKIGPKRKKLNRKYFNGRQATLKRIDRYLIELYPNGMDAFQAMVESDIARLKPRLNGVWTGCQAIHSDVCKTIGYADERFGMHFGADFDYIYRARAAGYLVHGLNHFVHHWGSFTLRKGCSGWDDIAQQSYGDNIMSEPNTNKGSFLKRKHKLIKHKRINEYEMDGKIYRKHIKKRRGKINASLAKI